MKELVVSVAKYFSVGVLLVACLPVLLPFLFLLSVFGFTFVLPLGCALGGLPYLRKYVGMLYKNLPDLILSAVGRRRQPLSPASPITIMAYLPHRFRKFLDDKVGEPEVLSKYYPPDFDPTKFPPRQPKNGDVKVRMRLPMRIECNSCGNYFDKGTNFNSLDYNFRDTDLGVKTLRLIFKCSRCSAELVMITDTQKGDFTMESGATPNFEPWRATDEAVDAAKSKRKAEEMDDATTGLENRTLDSKQEMEALDETKFTRAPHAGVGTTEIGPNKTTQEKEDEAVLRSAVSQSSRNFVRRRDDDNFHDDIEDSYFKKEFQQQGRKRRKEYPLEGNNEKRDGTVQSVSSSVLSRTQSREGGPSVTSCPGQAVLVRKQWRQMIGALQIANTTKSRNWGRGHPSRVKSSPAEALQTPSSH